MLLDLWTHTTTIKIYIGNLCIAQLGEQFVNKHITELAI
jgi:hypothetical protein